MAFPTQNPWGEPLDPGHGHFLPPPIYGGPKFLGPPAVNQAGPNLLGPPWLQQFHQMLGWHPSQLNFLGPPVQSGGPQFLGGPLHNPAPPQQNHVPFLGSRLDTLGWRP